MMVRSVRVGCGAARQGAYQECGSSRRQVTNGDRHSERAALLNSTLNLDRAAVLLDDPAGNGQSQASATHPSRSHFVRPPEAIEDVGLIGFSNPHSGVGYFDPRASIYRFHRDLNSSSFRCVLDAIVD